METDRSPLNSPHVQGNAAESQNSYPTAWSGRGDATEGGFDPASPDIRVILEQLNNGPTDGGYRAGICFELSAHRSVGGGVTIDPATGSLPGHRGRWNLACLPARTWPGAPDRRAVLRRRPGPGVTERARQRRPVVDTSLRRRGDAAGSVRRRGRAIYACQWGVPGRPPVNGPKMVTSSTEPAPRRAGSQR